MPASSERRSAEPAEPRKETGGRVGWSCRFSTAGPHRLGKPSALPQKALPQRALPQKALLQKTLGLELDLDVLPVFGAVYFEELAGLEAKHSGNDVDGEGLYPGVVVANDRVVVTPGVLDVVLNGVERRLQANELLGGFKLRIILGDGKQTLQCAAQLILSLRLVDRGRSLHGLRAKFGNVFESSFFVGGVSLDCLHQVGDQVVTAFELHVNI